MNKQIIQSVLASAGSVILATLIAIAGSDGGATIGSLPVFGLCAIIAFGIQWVAFIPAYVHQTEHYFDLIGSLTYLTTIAVALTFTGQLDARNVLLAAMITIWAVRLGLFLFRRVRQDGSDRRFNAIKPKPAVFFMTWTLQGLWVLLTLAAALAAISSLQREPIGWVSAIGAAMWASGFALEVVADAQKRAFKRDPANSGRFISTGLWAWSRHPNYFGEVLLWLGITLVAAPVLSGWQWVTLISPVFVLVLLTRISGIPMLERRADKRWGDEHEYQAYKSQTPVFWLRPPR